MDSNEKRTVVEEGTNFKGTLSSSCPIDVRGRIEGEIETPSLTVSESGAVHGRAKVGSVRSEGELSGEFEADRVELAGRVRDNTIIRARSLEVKLAATRGKMQVIFGECELSVGDEPTEQVSIEEPAPPPAIEAAPEPEPEPEPAPAPPPEPAPPVEPVLANGAPPPAPAAAEPEQAPAPAAALPEPDAAPAAPAAVPADASLDELMSAFRSQPPAEAAEAAVAVVEEEETNGKRKRRKKSENEGDSGWSQPPSQPPPTPGS